MKQNIGYVLLTLFVSVCAATFVGAQVDATFHSVSITSIAQGLCTQVGANQLLVGIACGSSGGGGTPGGSNNSIQYNSSGSFAGASLTGVVVGNGTGGPPTALPGNTLPAHFFATTISNVGALTGLEPVCGDLTDGAASCHVDTTNATNITAGILPAARLPLPTASTLGGILGNSAGPHQFANGVSSSTGGLTFGQPQAVDVNGLGDLATAFSYAPPAFGATTPNTAIFSAITDTAMSGGPFCVHETGGVLSATAADCGAGGGGTPMYPHSLTETSGAVTLAVNSTTASFDINYFTANANVTSTFPGSSSLGAWERIEVVITTTGTTYTTAWTAGAGETLKSRVLGDTGTPGAACPALPATGSERYDWQWDGTNMTLLSCAANPPAATQAVSVGGTGQNAVSSWPIVAVHSTTMSGNFTESMQSAWVTSELVTVTATGVITLGAAGWAGQTLNMLVCQNATGNFNVSFAVSGVTVVGTFPQITTLASQCGDLTVHYITTTSAYLYGSQNGPLGASTISGTFVNACKANVTLSSGSGTFSNACVLTTSACFAQDITTPANSCKPQVPTNGSVAVSGTGSDVCVTACE